MYRNTKLYSVISYITWIGFAASVFLHENGDRMVEHHLNQALVINLLEIIGGILMRRHGVIGMVGGIIDFACLVLCLMGIVRAARLSDEPLPLIGNIHIFG